MTVDVVELNEIHLAGMFTTMSLQRNTTYQLWNKFMKSYIGAGLPRDANMYSVSDYGTSIIDGSFSPALEYQKWACAEEHPELMKLAGVHTLVIPAGLYATLEHHGEARMIGNTIGKFYSQWLPDSDYVLDERLHFELMGERYLGHENPNSVEELFIPVKHK